MCFAHVRLAQNAALPLQPKAGQSIPPPYPASCVGEAFILPLVTTFWTTATVRPSRGQQHPQALWAGGKNRRQGIQDGLGNRAKRTLRGGRRSWHSQPTIRRRWKRTENEASMWLTRRRKFGNVSCGSTYVNCHDECFHSSVHLVVSERLSTYLFRNATSYKNNYWSMNSSCTEPAFTAGPAGRGKMPRLIFPTHFFKFGFCFLVGPPHFKILQYITFWETLRKMGLGEWVTEETMSDLFI